MIWEVRFISDEVRHDTIFYGTRKDVETNIKRVLRETGWQTGYILGDKNEKG